MGSINFGRVLLGGLLAGLILNLGDFVLNEPVLGEQWKAAMESHGMGTPDSNAIMWFMLMNLIAGIGLVWLYAAIRPRFGANAKTAVIAGLIVWFFAWLWNNSALIAMGTFPTKLMLIGIVWGFFQFPIASIAGAWLYKE